MCKVNNKHYLKVTDMMIIELLKCEIAFKLS